MFDVESFVEQYEENPEIKEGEMLLEARESLLAMNAFLEDKEE